MRLPSATSKFPLEMKLNIVHSGMQSHRQNTGLISNKKTSNISAYFSRWIHTKFCKTFSNRVVAGVVLLVCWLVFFKTSVWFHQVRYSLLELSGLTFPQQLGWGTIHLKIFPCPGLGWDRVNFLPSRCYSAMCWI